jgi:serine/threonine-protein kinase
VATPAPALDASPPVASPAPAEKREEKTLEKPVRSKGGREQEALPATILADLEAGERALAAKDAAEAIRLARHSLYEKKTSRAAAILTRAYCLQGDLGAAKAELSHVAAAERARVLRACHAAGLDL